MTSDPEEEPVEEQTSHKRLTVILIVVLAVLVLGILAVFYCIRAQSVRGRFPEQTYLNGIDVGGMTAARASAALVGQSVDYTLTIAERDGAEEVITAEDIGLSYVIDGDVGALLAEYNRYHWFFDNHRVDELTVSTDTSIDWDLALEVVEGLDCFTQYTASEDAQLVLEDNRYEIRPEVVGTELDTDAAVAAICDALESRQTEIDLEELGLYLSPSVYGDDPDLTARAEQMNLWMDACVTLDFGDGRIFTIDGSVISGWMRTDGDDGPYLDYDAAYDYVKTQIAYQVDTFGLTHIFTTHSGVVVQLSGGDYGWCLARGDTTDKILEAVEAGLTTEVEPEWQYKAQNLGYDDIGGTFVEVSISEQMMWCYDDYQLVVETPVVTGNVTRGNGTPYGSVWAIDGMKRDAVLGTMDTMGYESPVNVWMPFTGNVGIHDADGWRSSYGDDIYLSNGSHGCVNTPLDAAEKIFETVTVGTAVIVYDLEAEDTVIISGGDYEAPVTDDEWDWDD